MEEEARKAGGEESTEGEGEVRGVRKVMCE